MAGKLFFTLILALLIIPFTYAEEKTPLPDEEAPLSLFSSKIGDADVDFLLSGYWKTSLQGGFGLSWNSEGSGITSTPFPGFSGTPVFSQEPDITLSLWLKKQYFFETSFVDNYALNTILFGYNAADENDFLQKVRIGNTDIGLGTFSLLTIPAASTDSLGAMAMFKGPNSRHQITVRFDPAQKAEKSFVGNYEVQDIRIPLSNYMRGSFFILPDKDVENLRVYIEDASGSYTDGTSFYRLATADDAIISAKEGYVFFYTPQNSKIAVHYTKNGATVGDVSLGTGALAADSDGLGNTSGDIDITGTEHFYFTMLSYLGMNMSDLKTTINGETALLLYQPGVFSPFQMLSVYHLSFTIPEDGTPFNALLVAINMTTGDETTFQAGQMDKTIMFVRKGDNSLRNPANRYPFADRINSSASIYGPEMLTHGEPPDKELLIEQYEKVTTYNLGDTVLDGSVEMLLNGQKNNRFSFDKATGTVTLLFPPAADDRIDFFYRTKAAGNQGGDLLAGIGNHFDFSDNLSAEIGAGIRWNISKGKYTEKENESPGSILASGSLIYNKKNIEARIDGGISFYSPDTTGVFRLIGMNTGGFLVPITENLLYPSAAPSSGISLLQADRGELFYKDYHKYSSFRSSVLMKYDWTPFPSDQEYPYANEGRTGPYIASSGYEIDGDVAVFDYALETDQWVGGRIPLSLGSRGLDLSRIQGITLKVKLLGATGSIQTYIRLGHLGEDLDGDGILDEETADFEKGFTYNPVYGGETFSIKVGSSPDGKSGNGQIDTEDLDGNGILDGETADTIDTFTGGVDYNEPSSSWTTISINLTPSEREKLHNATGFEIIIKEAGTGTAAGRLLVGDIVLNGSSFTTAPGNGQNVTAEEGDETLIDPGGSLLESSFSEVESTFSPSGSPQNIGKFSWSAADGTWDTENGSWTASSFTQPVTLSHYGELVFYMKTPANAPDVPVDTTPYSMSVSFTNPDGKGIDFAFTPTASNNWQKYVFDYRTKTLLVNGSSKEVQILQDTLSADKVNKFTLKAGCSSSGKLYLDEIHLENAVFGISGGVNTHFSYSRPGALIRAGGTPIVSNFSFSNNSRMAGNNFATGFSSSDNADLSTSSECAFSLFSSHITGNLDIQKEETNIYFSPGWGVIVPFPDGKGTVKDSYKEYNGYYTRTITRENGILLSLGSNEFFFNAGSSYNDSAVTQQWDTGWKRNGTRWNVDTSTTLNTVIQSDPYDGEDFSERILTSYKLMVPLSNPYPQRNITFIFNGKRSEGNSAVDIQEKMTTVTTGTTERKVTRTQNITLDVPLIFNKDTPAAWKLVPSYSRTLSMTETPSTDQSFSTDAVSALEAISSQTYYFTSIPFYELVRDGNPSFSLTSERFDTLTYTPAFSLSFLRQSQNTPSDIVIPSSVQLSVSRIRNREWSFLTDTKTIAVNLENNVFNLYGKMGSHPFFTWYQTEEFTSKTGIKAAFSSVQETAVTLHTNQYLNFIILKGKSLSLESDLSLQWLSFSTDGTFITTYTWLVPEQRKVRIPVIDPDGEGKDYFSHKENFTVKYNYTGDTNELKLTFTLNHTTDFVIGEKGKISAFAGIGFSQQRISQNSTALTYTQLGFEGGIQAQLNF